MAKLQLALDDLTMDEALALVENLTPYIDIIELGTPFLMEYGMPAVRKFREQFSDKTILADLKIMDAGYYEASIAYKAGADYVTVLGTTDVLTIEECQRAASEYGKKLFVDMICVQNLPERVRILEDIGVYGIAVHVGVDQQKKGVKPIDDLKVIVANRTNAKIAVAGGISSMTAKMYKDAYADILISGNGICHAADPLQEARTIKTMISER